MKYFVFLDKLKKSIEDKSKIFRIWTIYFMFNHTDLPRSQFLKVYSFSFIMTKRHNHHQLERSFRVRTNLVIVFLDVVVLT